MSEGYIIDTKGNILEIFSKYDYFDLYNRFYLKHKNNVIEVFNHEGEKLNQLNDSRILTFGFDFIYYIYTKKDNRAIWFNEDGNFKYVYEKDGDYINIYDYKDKKIYARVEAFSVVQVLDNNDIIVKF